MLKVIEGNGIDASQWAELVKDSPVATWFQTQEAYGFFNSLPFFEAFAFAVEKDGKQKGVAVGYIQKDGGKLKQFFSRRAIIIGGPLLSDDIAADELKALLDIMKTRLKSKAIYVETRNFNDYSRWRHTFEECGFRYEPHLNFHLFCDDWDKVENKIGKHRRRYIRLSLKNGAKVVDNPSIEQVRSYYSILDELYRTKVKSPLLPQSFFEALFRVHSSRFVLIEYEGNIVGGSVCVALAGKAVYEWFACGRDGEYKNIYPSSLTKYEGIRFAHNSGCKLFDMMGAGKPDEKYGVRDFKAEFGGELVEHGRYVYVCRRFLFGLGKIAVKCLKMR